MLLSLLSHPSGIFALNVLPFLTLQNFLYLDSAAACCHLRGHVHGWARSKVISRKITYKIDRDIAVWMISRRVLLTNIEFCGSIKDDQLSHMAELFSECTSVSFQNCRQLSESTVISVLNGCAQLVSADFGNSGGVLTDAVVMKIAEQNHDLLKLDLCIGDNITDQAIHTVAQNCPKLKKVNLIRCNKLTSEALLVLVRSCPELEDLNLRLCSKPLAGDSLVQLAQHLKNLQFLSVYSCGTVNDAGITAIATHCTRLLSLDIGWNSHITDVGVIALAKGCCHLQSLEMSFVDRITSESVVAIAAHCKNLHVLDVQCCREVRDDGILALSSLGNELKFLHIGGCGVGDSSILDIAEHCPDLEVLNVPGCYMLTDQAVIRIAECCTNLISLDVAKSQRYTDAVLDALAQHSRRLRVLNLRDCKNITGAAVMRVVQACSQLRTLCVFSCPLVTKEDEAELKKYVDVSLLP